MEIIQEMPIFDSLVLSITSKCNLACPYCQTGPFISQSPITLMPDALLSKIMFELFEVMRQRSQKCINICFSGGEPLLAGLEYFRNILKFQKQHKENDLEVINTIQTNGTLLNNEWASFISDNNINVSISIDGPSEIQNFQRPMLPSRKSFSLVMKGMDALRSRDVEFGVISVITEDSAKKADAILRFLLLLEPRLIAFLPCAERGSVVSTKTFGRFMTEAFDLWIDPTINKQSVPERVFREIIRHHFGIPGSKACDYFGQCPRHPNITPDGRVTVCDQYVGKDDGFLGNIKMLSLKDILDSQRVSQFLQYSKDLPQSCLMCNFLELCNGGCVYRRSKNNGFEPFCETRIQLFQHVINRVTEETNYS